jgi:phosphatidylglycerol:prolipoprotein diacylglycerol transferase
VSRVRAKRPDAGWKSCDVDAPIFFEMLGGDLGGRLGQLVFYGLKFWAKDLWYPLKIWEGGMSFHGGRSA